MPVFYNIGKVKLIIGFIFKDETVLEKAEKAVTKKTGPVDKESCIFDFDGTDYYKKEFGDNLKKKFVSIKRLFSCEDIYKLKIETNMIEKALSRSGKRLVNIDPGYVTESKLVLFTTKDYWHRVYLRRGIYAEVTLKFQNGTFKPIDTTYPDYRREDYIKFFNDVRAVYREDLI